MGKQKKRENNKNNIFAISKNYNSKKVRKKTEVIFDESKRADFLTGFRKRKDERRKRAKTEFEKKLKDEIKSAKEKAKTDMNEIQSASHRVVPEIEHLLKSAVSTNIHDLGSHTVSVTHLDLDQKREESQSEESEESEAESEEEKPKSKKPLKPFDKKTLKKTLSRTNNKLQAFNKGSKGGNKYNRKTMKSKRSKHFNPKRKVPE